MIVNSYAGIVEEDVSRLVVSRAYRMRVPREEIDDLQQQIVPKLASFEYEVDRSNGATERTVLTAVIDNQIKSYLRSKRRYELRIERVRQWTKTTTRRPMSRDNVTMPEPTDLRMDVAAVIDTLPQREQLVCEGLAAGHTKKAIAEQIGCGRDTVTRAIARIRKAFESAKLQAWIDPDFEPEVGE